jgi:transposase-like protein
VALGANFEGRKEALELRIAENEGAKFWMGVLTGLKNHGVQGILIACMDWLTGFPDALRAVCSQARIQLCIARMARNSVKFVSCKGLKKPCADPKQIYSDDDEEAGLGALEGLGRKWNGKYPMVCRPWQRHWNGLGELFKYPPEIRKGIYTANADDAGTELGAGVKPVRH